jgi:hypothetical protein
MLPSAPAAPHPPPFTPTPQLELHHKVEQLRLMWRDADHKAGTAAQQRDALQAQLNRATSEALLHARATRTPTRTPLGSPLARVSGAVQGIARLVIPWHMHVVALSLVWPAAHFHMPPARCVRPASVVTEWTLASAALLGVASDDVREPAGRCGCLLPAA